MDDNFTLDKSYILELCNKIIEKDINIQFDTLNGLSVNSLDEEVIEALVKVGLVRVAISNRKWFTRYQKKYEEKPISRKNI